MIVDLRREEEKVMRYKGVVKWFNNTKGYGFILSDDFSEELFVHYSYVDMEGYKTLKADQTVTFETQQTPTGFHAKSVQVVGAPTDAEVSGNRLESEEHYGAQAGAASESGDAHSNVRASSTYQTSGEPGMQVSSVGVASDPMSV